MFPRFLSRLLVASLVWLAADQVVHAQAYFGTESVGYVGTWREYTDQALTNMVASGVTPQHDLNTNTYGDTTGPQGFNPSTGPWLQSLFYQSVPPGNPFQQSISTANFLGVYNTNLSTNKMFFADPNLNSFSVVQSGSTSGNLSRFDPNAALSIGASQGDWLNFTFVANVAGIQGKDIGGGFFDSSNSNPTAASGYFSGLFKSDPTFGGSGNYFEVALNINDINIARLLGPGGIPGGTGIYAFDEFTSSQVIPEPTSCLAFAMVFAASAGYGWRRKRQARAVAPATETI